MTLSEINYRFKISFGIFAEWKWTVMSQTGHSWVKMNGPWSWTGRLELLKLHGPKLDGLSKWTVLNHKVIGLNGEKCTAQRIKTGWSFQIKVGGPLEIIENWQDIKPFTPIWGYWVWSFNKANFFVIFVATYTCRIILLVISSTSKISDPEDKFSIFPFWAIFRLVSKFNSFWIKFPKTIRNFRSKI